MKGNHLSTSCQGGTGQYLSLHLMKGIHLSTSCQGETVTVPQPAFDEKEPPQYLLSGWNGDSSSACI